MQKLTALVAVSVGKELALNRSWW